MIYANRLCATLVSLAALLSGPCVHAQASAPVKIGIIGPFSGPSSDFGQPMLQGIELAIEEINAVGGYLGRPLTLVVKDDQGKPDVGLERTKELLAEGVIATIGFCNTGVAMKSLEVFQQAQAPLIVPCASGSPITTTYPAPDSYIFRTSAPDSMQAPFVVDDLVKRGWTRVAIFADNTAYGSAGLKDVESALTAKGLKATYVARFDLKVSDLSEPLKAARAAGANVIFSYTVGTENAVIAKGRQALGWNVPQVGAWPLSFPFFIDGAAAAAEGALMAQTFIAEPSNERRAAFLSAHKRKFNKPLKVPMAAAQAYDATYLLAYALFRVPGGKFTGPSVKRALESIPRTYYGVVATYEHPFTAKDKVALTQDMLVMGMVKNGKVTFAYAEDAKRNLLVRRKK